MDQMALSALGELANMITGNAAIGLAGAGFSTDLTPPTLIQPKGSKFTTLGCPQIVVPFRCASACVRTRTSSLPESESALFHPALVRL